MTEMITIGGGCFWCIEAVLKDLQGVESVVSGYSGGSVPKPTYMAVCSGITGHAEVVQVTYNPEEIKLHDILTIFFTLHDPTTLNRQGADSGTQYRSVIFYHTEEQKVVAQTVMKEIADQEIWDKPVVTELSAFTKFYPAEDYHQNYYSRNESQPYCQVVIAPKVAKVRALYHAKLKKAA